MDADCLPAEARETIPLEFPNDVNKVGEFYTTSEVSQYQALNLKDCVSKLSQVIESALNKPPPISAEERLQLSKIRASERRVAEKERSAVKSGRCFRLSADEFAGARPAPEPRHYTLEAFLS